MGHALEIQLQHFLLASPKNLAELGIHIEKVPALLVHQGDAHGRSFVHRPESLLASLQCLFRPLALRDVLQHTRNSVNPTRPIDRKVRDKEIPLAALRVLVLHFELDDFALEALIQFFLQGCLKNSRVQYFLDRSVDHLLSRDPSMTQIGAIRDYAAVVAIYFATFFFAGLVVFAAGAASAAGAGWAVGAAAAGAGAAGAGSAAGVVD